MLTPTSVLPLFKAAVVSEQDCHEGCKVMDLPQENWGVDHIHDLEKINEDLCAQSIWVRLEYIMFPSRVNPLGTVVLWKLKKLPTRCILKLEILNLSLGPNT